MRRHGRPRPLLALAALLLLLAPVGPRPASAKEAQEDAEQEGGQQLLEEQELQPEEEGLLLADDLLPAEFCGNASDGGAAEDGEWEWLPAAEPGMLEVPAEVVNATLAQLGYQYLLLPEEGGGAEDLARGSNDTTWIPCSPDDLLVDLDGCQQADPGGAWWRFWLRFNVTCLHADDPDLAEHADSATFDALVLVTAAGEVAVNISSVVLDVDAAHAETMLEACTDPLCAECKPGGAPVDGAPPLPERCLRCVSGFEVNNETLACEEVVPEKSGWHRPGMVGSTADFRGPLELKPRASPPPPPPEEPEPEPKPEPEPEPIPKRDFSADVCGDPGPEPAPPTGDPGLGADLAAQYPVACGFSTGECFALPASPENPLKPCGRAFYTFYKAPLLCTRCDRPGCIDCKWCSEDSPGCVGGQACQAPCKPGFAFDGTAGCRKCGEVVPGCGRCRRCTGGSDCHDGVQCICCNAGLHFSDDGRKRCISDADGSEPGADAPEPYTPRPIPTYNEQPQPGATPSPSPAMPVVRNPGMDSCNLLGVPVPAAPTKEAALANGLTVPPMISYGVGTGAGSAAADGYSVYYLPCQPYGTNCWLAPAVPANPQKPCGVGFFMFDVSLRLCTLCTRPGCTDCAYCPAGMAGCEGSQYCVPPCQLGYAYNTGGCRTCGDVLPNCGRCSRCTGGPGCYDSMRCDCCNENFFFGGDNTTATLRQCIPVTA